MRLLIAGGGTGGHLYPGVAVAEELLARGGDNAVHFAGSATGIEARVLPRLGFQFTPVHCGPVVGRGAFGKVGALSRTALGVLDSLRVVARFRPDACLGVGGYASFPVAVAARMMMVKTAIQEQNALPGLANRALSTMAARIYTGDEAAGSQFAPAKTLITGTPLRNAFAEPFAYEPPSPGGPVRVLVLGGSQGAASLNRIVPKVLKMVDDEILEVRHQAGRGKAEDVRASYNGTAKVVVEEFIEDMAAAYEWAQIVIARAGALTLAELEGAGRPAVLVPFPHAAGGHQEANARAAELRGSAVCVSESELTAVGLADLVRGWIENPDVPTAMAHVAAETARREAAKLIVDDLLRLAGDTSKGKGG